MSTNSRIGIQNKDGTFTTIYCHFDGYISREGVGKTLLKHYTTEKKIRSLIRLGSLRSLGKKIGEKHDFDDCVGYLSKNYCKAYHRDRGDSKKDCKSRKIKNLKEWEGSSSFCEEYNYFFREGKWWVFTWKGLETLSTVEIELAFIEQEKQVRNE